jgi:hypothetical protein
MQFILFYVTIIPGVPGRLVAKMGQYLLQELVGQEASLFEAVHAFTYLQVNPTAYGYCP